MSVVKTSGTQTATGAENTLATITDAGRFQLVLDVSEMVNGDTLTIRGKSKVLSGGSTLPIFEVVLSNIQIDDVFMSPEIPSAHEVVFTIDEDGGSLNDYAWSVYDLNQVDVVSFEGGTTAASALNRYFRCFTTGDTSSAGTQTTIIDTALTQADDYWNGMTIMFRDGANIGLARLITDFDAATDTITVSPPFPSATGSGDDYVIMPLDLSSLPVDVLTSSGGSVNFIPIEDNTGGAIDPSSAVFVGSVVSGDFGDLSAGQTAFHSINDVGNDIDIVYGYQIGGGKQATSITVFADVDGGTDNIDVEVYDHIGGDWEVVGNIDDNELLDIPLLGKHTGSGAEIGKVYVRFNTNATTPANLTVWELIVSAVNIGQSVGYAQGAIWIDTNNGTAGTESFVNGVADNPVNSIADAVTLSNAIGINRFVVAAGSSITLAASAANYEFMGDNYSLAFGGQDISNSKITGATVSGTFVGSTAILSDCIINAITGAGITMRSCYIADVSVTANAAGDWYLNDCRSRVAGTGSPNFDFGAGIANVNLSLRSYSGGIEIENIGDTGTDNMSMEGDGKLTLNANCDGGTIAVRGNIRIADNSGGNVTLEITPDVTGYQEGAVWVDQNDGTSSGTVVGIDGTFQNQSNDLDNAKSIADALGTGDIILHQGNSITFSQAMQGYTIKNIQCTLNGGSQDADSTRINGGFVTGTWSRAGTGLPTFVTCSLLNVTAARVGILGGCGIVGTLTLTEAAVYPIIDAQAAGNGTSTIDFNSLGGATVNMERWTGNLIINNMVAGDTLNLHCTSAGDVEINGTGGDVYISGAVGSVDSSGFSGTLDDKSVNLANINAQADTALSDYDAPTKAELDAAQTSIESDIAGLNNFDPATDTVANVTLVDTVTTNTDMRGTDDALLDSGYTAPDNASITAILADTNDLQTNQGNWLTATGFSTFNPSSDTVARVTLVDTTTANTDMRGTDGANTTAPDNAGIAANGVAISALNNISVDNIFDKVVENSLTFLQTQRLQNSALLGKLSGAATTTNTFRDIADSKDRITATVDASGNRTAITLDGD